VTVRALFWDVGGVLLSNAWDHTQRAAALEHFGLDEKAIPREGLPDRYAPTPSKPANGRQ
jgi:hypothetical protein